MMIPQMQNIRQFVQKDLSDIIDPTAHVVPETLSNGEQRSNGDAAYVQIRTPYNRYSLAVLSAYAAIPAGAPPNCKQLGAVIFDDAAGNKHLMEPKGDAVYAQISKHIHVRELTDALAATRRQLAEAGPAEADRLRTKLAELAARAEKWGIKAKMPEGPAIMIAPDGFTENESVQDLRSAGLKVEPAEISGAGANYLGVMITPPPFSDAPAPFIGAPIVYVTNPGEQVGGMGEIPGWCVKALPGDYISCFITPDHSEPSYKDKLPRRGSPAGNGRVHRFNCWDFNPHWLAQQEMIQGLKTGLDKIFHGDVLAAPAPVAAMMNDVGWLREEVERLVGRVIALESAAKEKPRRGRPPKHEAEGEKHEAAEAAPAAGAGETEGAEFARETDETADLTR